MLTSQARAPWWHWPMLSVCTILSLTGITLALLIALAFRGVDVLDYVYLSHPPYLADGLSAALIFAIIGAQSLAPLVVLMLYRPGRALLTGVLARPEDLGSTSLRLFFGLALTLVLQVAWAQVSPTPAEYWRFAEHLVYAVVGGGKFWPMFWLLFTLGLVVPVAEEVIFRGLVFPAMRRRWGFMAAALGSAIVFGLPHGPAGALPTTILGFYLAYQAEQDGSLAGPIALHVINNLGALVAIAAGL